MKKAALVLMLVSIVAGTIMYYACSSGGGGGLCGLGGFMCQGSKACNCSSNGTWNCKDCSTLVGQICEMSNTGASCQPFGSPDGGQCGLGGFMCSNNQACNCSTSGTWSCDDCSKVVGKVCVMNNTGASCQPLTPPECTKGAAKCEGTLACNCDPDSLKWVCFDCSTLVGVQCVVLEGGAATCQSI